MPYKTRCVRASMPPTAARQSHVRDISTSPLQVTPQRPLQPLPRLAHAAFRVTGSDILLSVLPSCPSPSFLPHFVFYFRCGDWQQRRSLQGSCTQAANGLTSDAERNTSPPPNEIECVSLRQAHLRHSRPITVIPQHTERTAAAAASPLQNQVILPHCLTTGSQTQIAR